jgi:hypothetical protein
MSVQQPNLLGVDAAGPIRRPAGRRHGVHGARRDAGRDRAFPASTGAVRRSSSAGCSGSTVYSPSRKSGRLSRACRASLRYCHHSQLPATSPATSNTTNSTEATANPAATASTEVKANPSRLSQEGLGKGGNFHGRTIQNHQTIRAISPNPARLTSKCGHVDLPRGWKPRSRLALLTTVNDDSAMAAPASIGLSSKPVAG